GGEEWFVWHRQLDDLGHPVHRVEIAFRVGTASGERRLVKRDDSPLIVFFPTQKETFPGFLIPGGYPSQPRCSPMCCGSSAMTASSRSMSCRHCRSTPRDSSPARCSARCSTRCAR